MSGLEWLVLVGVVVLTSLGAGLVLGLIARSMGSDEREPQESKQGDLWAGYERRKVKPYE